MKTLCLLDLDHTLIYGSYAPSEETELLFTYSVYLKVYKRPFVDDFVRRLKTHFTDIIVYTTAKKDYAKEICRLLNIEEKLLLSRADCSSKNEKFYKDFQPDWGKSYEHISIIDDSPNVWLQTEAYADKVQFVVPNEFRGEKNDCELEDLQII